MESQQLVSVVIAVRQTEFLDAALQSVVDQTYSAIEIVICDDTQGGVVQSIVNLHQRRLVRPIRYLRNEHQRGLDQSLIQGVAEASGEYIKFLAEGDLLAADCIAQMVHALQATPEASLVAAARRWIDAQDVVQPENLQTRPHFSTAQVLHGPDVVAFLGEFTCNFIGELSSVMCRRSELVVLGEHMFSLNGETLNALASLGLYARLLQQGDLVLLPSLLSTTRIAPRDFADQGIETAGADTEDTHRFHRLIRESGWNRPTLDNGFVRVRAAKNLSAFTDFNLLASLGAPLPHRLTPEQVQAWLDFRNLTDQEHERIKEHLSKASIPSLLVVIDDRGDNAQRTQRSLDSLGPFAAMGANVQVVVLAQAVRSFQVGPGIDLNQMAGADANFSAALNRIVDACQFDWLVTIEAGTLFTPFGLTACTLKLLEVVECRAAFADEMHRSVRGELSSALRPDFNLDYLLSYPLLTAGHWLFSRQLLVDVGGFDPQFGEAAQFDLILRMLEREGPARTVHVREPLLVCDAPQAVDNPQEIQTLERHLKICGHDNARVVHTLARRYHVLYGHTETPLVSIIIPTRDQLPLLQRCVETLLLKTRYANYELLIVDNDSSDPEALAWLAQLDALGSDKVRVLRYPHPFNYSRINNVAASHARGEYLVLLNNDTAIVHERWLDEMLNHALRPEVAIVGAKLLYPSYRLQHAGVRLGLDGPAGHPHLGEPFFIQGYMQRGQVDQNMSAVTAACLMIRRSIYEEVGGLDETDFVVSYNDIDLCLKVATRGYLTVWTPHAVLIHEGNVSQNTVDTASQQAKKRRFLGEQLAMYQKWLPRLADDQAFNPLLSFDLSCIELEVNLRQAWRPLAWQSCPTVLAYSDVIDAAAQERIVAPFEHMQRSNLINGLLGQQRLSLLQQARLKPQVIVFQASLDDEHLRTMAMAKMQAGVFVVLDLCNVQLGSPTSDDLFSFSPEQVERLEKNLQLADRVIAATPLLADLAREFHKDVRLLPSRLDVSRWGNLTSHPGTHHKPRVGLVSQSWQADDLYMLIPVIRQLADEVEWVVMGDQDEVLRGEVLEHHAAPDPVEYPAALAALSLNLALLPAVDNLNSACKTNISLLQLGSCAIPVVCSAVRAYEGEFEVTRVAASLSAWTEAIRSYTRNPAVAAQNGERLRAQVLRDWMFDERALQTWHAAWIP